MPSPSGGPLHAIIQRSPAAKHRLAVARPVLDALDGGCPLFEMAVRSPARCWVFSMAVARYLRWPCLRLAASHREVHREIVAPRLHT